MKTNHLAWSHPPLRNLSVFFPAYFDEGNIGKVVTSTVKVLEKLGLDDYEIVIVEDGSPDKTAEVADELARRYNKVRVVHHPENLGYGATLNDGFKSARYDWVFYTDGDDQFDVNELPKLIEQLSQADLAVGYRIKKQYSAFRRFTSWCYNWQVRLMFNLDVKDVNCAFKLVPHHLLDQISISSKHGFIDAEILLQACRRGYKIAQVGVTHRPRVSGVSKAAHPRVVLGTIYETWRFWWQNYRAVSRD
ncbi:MAG: hypothetical protein A3E37_02700 [Candidatus Andersenbacteria bacterium RIFCSPHIGHO2_12_FULL_46_9]|nr:MAG: Glycosyltransferase [Parcubacteria group bacterium GW2011_GWA2_45_14]OGY35092.1 MAG: hypothetical protein A3B76_04580 [Candidatus Andersenbacteria bacterium RIFCSPHIGHO2_02_FULL_46_16]OGY38548.1 MAG: hypothetical protein A3E37_02700 [Candidatus Andersenbacteria bacterium RIFCSPHIGHO2_12_FULL_46_9]HBE90437.1 glycosyltransferase family 2 protein [Candidatus Andersenbacteria bacterium]